MNTEIRCPYLDRQGRNLIEAYRRLEDHPLDAESIRRYEDIHRLLSDHRSSCSICSTVKSLTWRDNPKRVALSSMVFAAHHS
jgi:hypothetical protein